GIGVSNHLRICIVSYRFAPVVGGAEKRAEKLARQLVAFGHEVTVVTLHTQRTLPRHEWVDGIQVIRIGGIYRRDGTLRLGKFGRIPSDLLLLLKLLRLRGSYDIMHACQFSTFAVVATLVAQLLHAPMVISSQSAGPSMAQSQRLRQKPMLLADTLEETDALRIVFNEWAFAGNDASNMPYVAFGGGLMLRFLRHSQAYYQVLSTRCRTLLIEQGFPPDHMVFIPGSVDTDKFAPVPGGRPLLDESERLIICVARLEYSKGVDVLLHAWKRMLLALAQQAPQLKPRLSIVGGGELLSQMLWIATSLDILSSVEFLGMRNDVLALLQNSRGFVFPSRWEGMPNALLEAMACGLPCIATRVSGSEDIITSEVDGLLVPSEDPVALADALCRLLCDDVLAQRLGEQARTTVVQKYRLSHVVAQCLDLYQRLLVPCDGTLQHATESRGGE
ncbi:MAG TPA: glycosyltransferase family 4 protein, partial [Ktedonobacteraceae bacterium]